MTKNQWADIACQSKVKVAANKKVVVEKGGGGATRGIQGDVGEGRIMGSSCSIIHLLS